MLLTAGERISNALVAMAIHSLGAEARSFTGSQAGVITTASHGKARIIDVTPGRVRSALDELAVRFGSIEEYFATGLGIDHAEQETLRRRLLVEAA